MTEQKEPKLIRATVVEISTRQYSCAHGKDVHYEATVKFWLSGRIADFDVTKEQFDVLREALEENTHVVLPDGKMDGVYIEHEAA